MALKHTHTHILECQGTKFQLSKFEHGIGFIKRIHE